MENTSTKTPRVFGLTDVKRVFNGVLNQMYQPLKGSGKAGGQLLKELIARRNQVADQTAADYNEAVAVTEMWNLLNELIVRSGELAGPQLAKAKDLWAGPKARDFDHRWPSVDQNLADFAKLWVNAEGEDHPVIGRDRARREQMEKVAKAMLTILADQAVWAPYGRCKCGNSLRPDQNGRLHEECGKCYHAKKISRQSGASVFAQTDMTPAELAKMGVTFIPANTVRVEPVYVQPAPDVVTPEMVAAAITPVKPVTKAQKAKAAKKVAGSKPTTKKPATRRTRKQAMVLEDDGE